MRRSLMALFILSALGSPVLAIVPDMVCQEPETLNVKTGNLEAHKTTGQTIFRFKNSKLYLSSPNREEYFYNDVTEQSYGRFNSGNKTILFSGQESVSGLVVHSDTFEVRISKIHCVHAQ